jgi:hypothetical protein
MPPLYSQHHHPKSGLGMAAFNRLLMGCLLLCLMLVLYLASQVGGLPTILSRQVRLMLGVGANISTPSIVGVSSRSCKPKQGK